MAFIDDLDKEIKDEIIGIFKYKFSAYLEEIKKDAGDFLEKIANDIQNWLGQIKSGALAERDFTGLMKSKKNLMKLPSLTNAGLSVVKMEDIRLRLLGIIVRGSLSLLAKGFV